MRNRKWIVSSALGGVFLAATLAVTTLSVDTAKAADFCDTISLNGAIIGKQYEKQSEKDFEWEKRVRDKCKVGDIIISSWPEIRGRLCDLHQPFDEHLCFLAPPRKTY